MRGALVLALAFAAHDRRLHVVGGRGAPGAGVGEVVEQVRFGGRCAAGRQREQQQRPQAHHFTAPAVRPCR